mmetsp:Transcript_22633/g.34596  ORF Transcript_22633/g.34596 Transcript_22633/m.34596 type:complete len:354 (+) Transcript_22633:1-1062(+)
MADEAKERLSGIKDEYLVVHERYKQTVDILKADEKSRLKGLFENITKEKIALDVFCKTSSEEDCSNRRTIVNEEHTAQAELIAHELVHKTTKEAQQLMKDLITLVTKAESLRLVIQRYIDEVHAHKVLFGNDFGSPFFQNLEHMQEKLPTIKKLIDSLHIEITRIQTMLIGNICFTLDGVQQGEARTQKLNEFEKAVQVVTEDVLVEQDILVDVLYAQTVQTKFIADPKNERQRKLFLDKFIRKGIQVLRVMLGFKCNCEDDDPIEDIWGRRRRRRKRRLGKSLPNKGGGSNRDTTSEIDSIHTAGTRILSQTIVRDRMEELLQVYVETIFDENVKVATILCGTVEYNRTYWE